MSFDSLQTKLLSALKDGGDCAQEWQVLVAVSSERRIVLSGPSATKSLVLKGGSVRAIEIKLHNITSLTLVGITLQQVIIQDCSVLRSINLIDMNVSQKVEIRNGPGLSMLSISGTGADSEINELRIGQDRLPFPKIESLSIEAVKVKHVSINVTSIGAVEFKKCEVDASIGWPSILFFTESLTFDHASLIGEWTINSTTLQSLRLNRCDIIRQISLDANRLQCLHFSARVRGLRVVGLQPTPNQTPPTFDLLGENATVSLTGTVATIVNVRLSGTFGTVELLSNGTPSFFVSSNASSISRLVAGTGGAFEELSLQLKSVTLLQLGNVEIDRQLTVQRSTVGTVEISRTKFKGSVLFDSVRFLSAPRIKGDTAFEFYDVGFVRCEFDDLNYNSQGHYRKLRHIMAELGNDPEEQRFGSLELICRTKNFSNHPFETCLGWLYRALNDCGLSLTRPLAWLFALWLAFATLDFWCGLEWSSPPASSTNAYSTLQYVASLWPDGCQSFFRSFANSSGPLRLIVPSLFYPASLGATTLQLTQVVLSSLFWFFFIVGVRRRFRLK